MAVLPGDDAESISVPALPQQQRAVWVVAGASRGIGAEYVRQARSFAQQHGSMPM
jgi:hypothetical protein